jgi:hypothetical protein
VSIRGFGGRDRDRTGDPLLAKHATRLQQLYHLFPTTNVSNKTGNLLFAQSYPNGSQSTARLLRAQSQQLATESQVLEDEVLPGTETAYQPAEEMSERCDQGKNFSGKSESSFSPSHSFCRCTTFWRGTPLTRSVLCVKLLNRSHGGPRTT